MACFMSCEARSGGGIYYLLLLKAVVQMFSPKSVQLDESNGKQRSGVAGIQHVFGTSTLNAAFLSRVFSRIIRLSSCNYTHRPSNYFVHRLPISFLSCLWANSVYSSNLFFDVGVGVGVAGTRGSKQRAQEETILHGVPELVGSRCAGTIPIAAFWVIRRPKQ